MTMLLQLRRHALSRSVLGGAMSRLADHVEELVQILLEVEHLSGQGIS